MSRSVRIEFPGAFHHVMARGNRRQKIFLDDDDRRFFPEDFGGSMRDDGLEGARVGVDG